jgi:GTP-binding protein
MEDFHGATRGHGAHRVFANFKATQPSRDTEAGSAIASGRVCPRPELVKIESAVFKLSAPDLASSPAWAFPEFAFIGRSNVGKSSLINLLTERRDLAKVSDTPGKTKLLNFFVINNRWSLVDLPGYGYAAVGHRERDEFNAAVAEYLEKRKNLACVLALIDSRLPPQRIDLQFLNWLGDCGVPHVLVFTKTDKQSDTRTQANIDLFTQTLAESGRETPPVFSSSAKNKKGRGELLRFIESTLASGPRA